MVQFYYLQEETGLSGKTRTLCASDNNTKKLRIERDSTPEKHKQNFDVSNEGPSELPDDVLLVFFR
jgi:hypothetical protein